MIISGQPFPVPSYPITQRITRTRQSSPLRLFCVNATAGNRRTKSREGVVVVAVVEEGQRDVLCPGDLVLRRERDWHSIQVSNRGTAALPCERGSDIRYRWCTTQGGGCNATRAKEGIFGSCLTGSRRWLRTCKWPETDWTGRPWCGGEIRTQFISNIHRHLWEQWRDEAEGTL